VARYLRVKTNYRTMGHPDVDPNLTWGHAFLYFIGAVLVTAFPPLVLIALPILFATDGKKK
jgi:hypothetical protein